MKPDQHSLFSIEDKITDAQRNFFKKHGYIQFKSFIPREKVKELIAEIN